jgi:hypothetical protein
MGQRCRAVSLFRLRESTGVKLLELDAVGSRNRGDGKGTEGGSEKQEK